MAYKGPRFYLKKTVNGTELYLCRVFNNQQFEWREDLYGLRLFRSHWAACASVGKAHHDAEVCTLTDATKAKIPSRPDPWVDLV